MIDNFRLNKVCGELDTIHKASQDEFIRLLIIQSSDSHLGLTRPLLHTLEEGCELKFSTVLVLRHFAPVGDEIRPCKNLDIVSYRQWNGSASQPPLLRLLHFVETPKKIII